MRGAGDGGGFGAGREGGGEIDEVFGFVDALLVRLALEGPADVDGFDGALALGDSLQGVGLAVLVQDVRDAGVAPFLEDLGTEVGEKGLEQEGLVLAAVGDDVDVEGQALQRSVKEDRRLIEVAPCYSFLRAFVALPLLR